MVDAFLTNRKLRLVQRKSFNSPINSHSLIYYKILEIIMLQWVGNKYLCIQGISKVFL